MNDLPEGWTRARLPEVADLNMGQSPPSGSYNASGLGLPFFQGKAEFGEIYPTPVKYCSAPQKIAEEADILISVRAPVGPTNICREKSCIGRGLAAIRVRAEVTAHYVFYFLRSIEQWLASQGTGSTFTAISRSDLESIEVPLPPHNEQRRILAMLEELLGKVNACQKRLANVPVILKRFRQSVLADACSGRLTADWRDTNSHCESAFELLTRMSEKHQAEVEALAQHECPDDEIPSTWTWVRFGDLISELRNGVSIRPNMEPPGTLILRISATRPGRVHLNDIRYLPRGEQFFPQYKLADRDLLFTRYNGSLELLGVCGMVRDLGSRELLYPDKLMRVRFEHALVMPEYTEIFFQAASVHERVIAKAKSSAGQNGVSGADIKSQPFALPPLVEQEEIVRRVTALFKFTDLLEASYQKAKAQVDKLTQSILAKAFRGKLVPTEAELARREGRDYEPASVLLERIRTGRSNEAAVSATTKANRFQDRRLSKGAGRKKVGG